MLIYNRLTPLLSILVTFGYCWAIWWFSGLFSILVPFGTGSYETSMLSVVLVAPIPDAYWLKVIHWQVIACISLVFALRTATKTKNEAFNDSLYCLPLFSHVVYLVFISFLHAVGLLASIVAVAYTLK